MNEYVISRLNLITNVFKPASFKTGTESRVFGLILVEKQKGFIIHVGRDRGFEIPALKPDLNKKSN